MRFLYRLKNFLWQDSKTKFYSWSCMQNGSLKRIQDMIKYMSHSPFSIRVIIVKLQQKYKFAHTMPSTQLSDYKNWSNMNDKSFQNLCNYSPLPCVGNNISNCTAKYTTFLWLISALKQILVPNLVVLASSRSEQKSRTDDNQNVDIQSFWKIISDIFGIKSCAATGSALLGKIYYNFLYWRIHLRFAILLLATELRRSRPYVNCKEIWTAQAVHATFVECFPVHTHETNLRVIYCGTFSCIQFLKCLMMLVQWRRAMSVWADIPMVRPAFFRLKMFQKFWNPRNFS